MRPLYCVALAAMALLPSAAFSEDTQTLHLLKADEVGEMFCLARGSDGRILSGILSDGLTEAIATAERQNAEAEAQAPGDKPPLGDGIPWQSWQDYADTCAVGLVTLSSTNARVEIRYGFADYPQSDFTDTLLLKRVSVDAIDTSYWNIDNVAYATGGDLRTALREAFAAD
jgi:hypothetical protein